MRQLVDYLVYLAVRVFIAVVQALPAAVCESLAGVAASVFTYVVPMRRDAIDESLAVAAPDLSKREKQYLTWHMWRHLMLMVMEIAQTPRKVHRTNWRKWVDVPGVETIIRSMLPDRPSVVISGHYGNFELGGYLLGMFGFPTHTVARQLDNLYLDKFVNDFRGKTGQHMLPKKGSSEMIERLLDSNGSLTLLGDQAAGKRGLWVPFFGRLASTHKAVALFSLSYDAPTLVIGVRRSPRMMYYHVDIAASVDPVQSDFAYGSVPAMTEWYTESLERLIAMAPEQYWWVHRRWKGKVPARAVKMYERRLKQAA